MKTVEFEDIDADDFFRICEFAYTGNYSPPMPVGETSGKFVLAEYFVQRSSESAWRGHTTPRNSSSVKSMDFYFNFKRKYPKASRYQKSGKIYSQDHTEALHRTLDIQTDQDLTPVFLGHARVYSFADKYNIHSLQSIALQKLYETLDGFHLSRDRIGAVIELIRYTYQNTQESFAEPLRDLVAKYVAIKIDVIGLSADFYSLLREGGEFVSHFWALLQTSMIGIPDDLDLNGEIALPSNMLREALGVDSVPLSEKMDFDGW